MKDAALPILLIFAGLPMRLAHSPAMPAVRDFNCRFKQTPQDRDSHG